METFVTTLEKWLEVVSNFQKSNYSEWKYLQNRLFPKTVPLHAEWRDIDSIIKILNDIGSMPGLNHMFLPTGGGQDVESAKYANEEGCICLVDERITYKAREDGIVIYQDNKRLFLTSHGYTNAEFFGRTLLEKNIKCIKGEQYMEKYMDKGQEEI